MNCTEEFDMLKGEVRRMCVTDNVDELHKMTAWAMKRIDRLYALNKKRLEKEEIK